MKQLLVVLSLTALVLLGYFFYSGSKDAGPQRPAQQRPAMQQAKGENKPRPKANTKATESARAAAEDFLDEGLDSWKSMVTEETLVRMEDAWQIDTSGVDFDADVLLTMELPTGERVEITQSDWKRFLCLSLGRVLIEGKLLAISGHRVAADYDQPYGFTDDQWHRFEEASAAARGVSLEVYLEQVENSFGLPLEPTRQLRRNLVEGLLAYFPTVKDVMLLPKVVQDATNLQEERQYLNELNNVLAKARADLDAEGAMAIVENAFRPLSILFSKVKSEENFRRSWTFLDAELPENAVAGCFTGELVTDVVMAPWLQPNGGFEYIDVDEYFPFLPVDELSATERESYLRELVWFRVLLATQAANGIALAPEDAWAKYADEFIARSKTALDISMVVSGFKGYPSLPHYRGVRRAFEGFVSSLPEGFESEQVQREFYENHRMFVEAWAPQVEIILFTPRKLSEGSLEVDWDYARNEGERIREQIIAGEVDFTEYRNRHHAELKRLFAEHMGEAAAEDFDETFGAGEVADTVLLQQEMLSEDQFTKMINLASTIRNAVVRLDRGEISPLWKSPVGYVLIKVNGAGLASLESEWEDFKDQTTEEYERTMFYKWANEALSDAKQVVAN